MDYKGITQKCIKIILFLVLTYFVIFNQLGKETIRLWDESRVALNAYEMYQNGFSIVTTFEGKPDMWNVKPPLLIWMQVACMKVFGANEIAVRLPAAIGGFLTCCLLMWFGLKYMKSYWFGLLSVIVLITSKGFIFEHKIRTGEYEGILVLFTTLYLLSFFLYTELKEEKDKRFFLNLAFVGLTLAVLTKGIAGLLITPGVLLYIIYKKQFLSTLKRKQTYINLFLFLATIASYYLLREHYNEGYLTTVWMEEIGGRYEGNEQFKSKFSYYFSRFSNINFTNWYPFLIVGTGVAFIWEKPLLRNLTIYSLLVSFVFFMVISISGTHYPWYDMPAFPILSLITAIALYWILNALLEYEQQWKKLPRKILPYVLIISLCLPAYNQILKEEANRQDRNDLPMYDVTYYLRDAFNGKREIDGYKFLYNGYYPHNLFYLKKLKNEKNINIEIADGNTLEKGNKVIVHQKDVLEYIKANYNYSVFEEHKSVTIVEIEGSL